MQALGPHTYGLPVAPSPSRTPRLEVSQRPLDQLVRERVNPETLFISDRFNSNLIEDLGGRVEVVTETTPQRLLELLNLPSYPNLKYVVGIGGCTALDAAKAAAVGKECTIIPTVLSTNCITKNRTVVHDGEKAFSYQSATPGQVIVSLPQQLALAEGVHQRWSSSGFGDYFAKLAALVDQRRESGLACDEAGLAQQDPELLDSLNWVEQNFRGYDQAGLTKLAECAHEAGLKVVSAGRNDRSVGGEHRFYYAAVGHFPETRKLATHGHVVALGTLLTMAAEAELSGDHRLYQKVRSAFERLGIPTTQAELDSQGLTRAVIEGCLEVIGSPNEKPSQLGEFFKSGDFSLLDRVLGSSPEPWRLGPTSSTRSVLGTAGG